MIPHRQYAIAREIRRCCWYVIAAVPVLCALAAWQISGNDAIEPARRPFAIAFGCTIHILAGLVMAWPLSWRLRVDDQGLCRRRLWWCDLWPWHDIAAGHIRKQAARLGLVDPSRPWWRRTLGFSYLEESDHAEVMASVNAHYRLPPPPALPASIELAYQGGCTLVLDARGLHQRVFRKTRDYAWSDVRGVLIRRLDPLRRDFTKVVIVLPDREITIFGLLRETPDTRAIAAEFFARYLPAEKLDVALTAGPPNRPAHIEHELKRLQKDQREFRIVQLVGLALLAAWSVWFGFSAGVLAALFMTALYAVLIVPVFVWLDRLLGQRIAELQKRLREVVDTP